MSTLLPSNPSNRLMSPLKPSGPICAFGSRLAYTYFPSPTPNPDLLNSILPTTHTTTTSTEGEVGKTGTGTAEGVHWFTIDDQLVYLSFFQDYGPLNVGCLYRFCLHLHNLLEDPQHRHQRIFLYSSDEPDKKVNAALLMSLYAMVVMRWSVADVLHPISCLELQPYRDAGYSRSDYHLHPQSILYGLSRALSHQLLDLSTFDLAAYERAEKVEEGDWNWITPGFLAFASPVEAGWTTTTTTGGVAGGGQGVSPKKGNGGMARLSRAFRNVLEEFENKGVKVVVRLNKKLYDSTHFTERGIEHVEMYFDDGTNPSMEMCRRFIDLSDKVISSGGAVAVHCKAGLGRTGTLIGAYLIYKHGFTADEAIGFMRLMRPGSCVGPQQHFLYENQLEWVRWAAQDELRRELALPATSTSNDNHSTTTTNVRVRDGLEEGGGRERSAPPPRPITPPNEADLQRQRSTTPHHHHHSHSHSQHHRHEPVTPRRQIIVPGQPRKTPGRSRHGVAAPEVKDSPVDVTAVGEGEEGEGDKMEEEDELKTEEEQAMKEEEEMEGVVLSSPQKKRDSMTTRRGRTSLQLVEDGEEGTEEKEDEEDPLTLVSPKKLDLGSTTTTSTSIASTRPKTPSAATTVSTTSKNDSSRPTRIARATQDRQRPLSALADNRIVDRLRTSNRNLPVASSSTSSSSSTAASTTAAQAIARSRGAKNLNTVFEAVEGGGQQPSQTRYPLRNASGRTTPTASLAGGGVSTNVSVVPPTSPSKLPTRIPAKRGAAHQPHHSPDPSSTTTTQRPPQVPQQGNHPGFNPGAKGKNGEMSFAEGLAKLGGGAKGRNVRRRRSSMGSQDFVQAG